jgi:DNA-binding transcriptional regulator YbjK
MKKRYKTSKNTNELHILHQNAKKNNNQYFENWLQQKKGSFVT